ncbi:hypothetical protein MBANPS3_003571 [Mucor bainieri]
MDNSSKWRLSSGRFVEDVMLQKVLQTQPYQHPSQETIELANAIPLIDLPPLPSDMTNFLIDIPDTPNLPVIYNHLENCPLDYNTQQHLLWLKHSFQNGIDVIEKNYPPITNQKEEDICAHLWNFIDQAFKIGTLKAKRQSSTTVSKEAISKKRKMTMVEPTPPQQHALIPDITIVHGSQTYAIIEAAKTDNDTKQLVETYKKCPEIMAQVLDQLIKEYPSQQRNIKVYGSVLSQATYSPLMLSNPFEYVKVVSHGKKLSHPEVRDTFKPDMAVLLEHFWGLKLTIEATVDALSKSKYENSKFKHK